VCRRGSAPAHRRRWHRCPASCWPRAAKGRGVLAKLMVVAPKRTGAHSAQP
jgi:hypothetical protein